MSGTMGGDQPALPQPVKNEFFTYVQGARAPTQIWNAQGVSICVQGKMAPFAGVTYFGKKHLLTYKGGKHAQRAQGTTADPSWPGPVAKGWNIFSKRLPQQPGVKLGKAGSIAKYGKTKLSNESICTFINCDKWPVGTELHEFMARRLKIAHRDHTKFADIWEANFNFIIWIAGDGTWGETDRCRIKYEVDASGTKFMVTHLETTG